MLAGFATAVAGISLIFLAVFGQGVLSMRVAAGAVVVAALLELFLGTRLTRRGGAGMAHVFAGVTAVGFMFYLLMSAKFDPAVTPQPVALMLGLFCLCNGLFRGIDLFVDRPAGALAESIDCVFTFVLGAVLCTYWREASAVAVGVAAGIELLSGGIAMIGSAYAFARHETPYGVDRFTQVKAP